MCCNRLQRLRRGFTLIEVLVTIVVIAISATAILSVFTSTVRRSADPLIQQQAIAIAEAYLEEINSKRFCEDLPALPNTASDCAVLESGGAEGETRVSFDDVKDYAGSNADGAVVDQNNVPISGLEDYSVDVEVVAASLSNSDGDSLSNPTNEIVRIDVTVDHPAIDPIVLSVFRANY